MATVLAPSAAQAQVPTDSIVADFREFVRLLEEIHPDPYSGYGGKPYFRMAAADARNALRRDKVTDVREFGYRINEFLAPLKDGHTVAMPDGHYIPGHFPITYTDPATLITFEAINDGIIVKALPDEYKDLIGSCLAAIENVAVKDLASGMAKYFISENNIGSMMNLANYAMQPKALRKVTSNLKEGSITYQLKTPNGKNAEVTLPVVPFDQVQHFQANSARPSIFPDKEFSYNFMEQLVYGFVDDENDVMYLHPKHILSRDYLDYLREHNYTNDIDEWLQGIYDAVGMPVPPDQNMAIALIPSLSEEFYNMLQQMKQHGSKNLIIDMRDNGGGNTDICRPMVYLLYGDKYLTSDILRDKGIIPVSPRTISKSVIDEINATNEYKIEYGDYLDLSDFTYTEMKIKDQREHFIKESMCSIKEKLRAMKGQPVYTPEHVYVVTNALTYSAAFHFSYYLWRMGATVVGVTSSQAPNTFMGGQQYITLPRTGLVGEIDRGIQICFPDDDPHAKEFYPDLMPTYEDYKRYNFDDNAPVLYLLDIIKKNSD